MKVLNWNLLAVLCLAVLAPAAHADLPCGDESITKIPVGAGIRLNNNNTIIKYGVDTVPLNNYCYLRSKTINPRDNRILEARTFIVESVTPYENTVTIKLKDPKGVIDHLYCSAAYYVPTFDTVASGFGANATIVNGFIPAADCHRTILSTIEKKKKPLTQDAIAELEEAKPVRGDAAPSKAKDLEDASKKLAN